MKLPMKKYIAPEIKNINLYAENIMLLDMSNKEGSGDDLSNRREDFSSASESIWGNGWEE